MARTATSWARGIGCVAASAGLALMLIGCELPQAGTPIGTASAEAPVEVSIDPSVYVPVDAGDSLAPEEPPMTVAQLAASEAYRMMQQEGELVVLDVRTDQEYARGHLPEAVLLPYDMVDARTAATVIPSSTTPVLVYCRSGRRAELALEALSELGYTNVYSIGGIESWPYATTATAMSTVREVVNPPSYQHMAHLAR